MAGVPSSSASVPVCWFLTYTSPLTKTACVSSLPLDKFCLNMQTCDLDTLPDFYRCAQCTPTIALPVELSFFPQLLLSVPQFPGCCTLQAAPVAEHQPWTASWNVKPYRVKITLQRWTPFLLTGRNPSQQWMKFYPKKKKTKTLGCKKNLTAERIHYGVLLFNREKIWEGFKTSINYGFKMDLHHLFSDYLLLKEI